ncbi:MAG: hypothetical protein O2854_03870 [Chloroflexi bacterium]|nr:hypothetical protein [Chloroflexota bacterium]
MDDVSTAFGTEPEAPAQETTAVQPETTAEVDWKARAEELQSRNEKLEQQSKTNTGRRQSEDTRAAREAAIQAELKATRLDIAALADHIASGDKADPEKLKARLDASSKEAQAGEQRERVTGRYERLLALAQRMVAGSDGKAIFDLANSPELNDWRSKWMPEYNKMRAGGIPDFDALGDLISDLADIKFDHVVKTNEAALKTERDARKKTKSDVVAEFGLDNMDIGPGSGGSESLETLSKKDTRKMTPTQLREHDKLLTAAMSRG